MGKILSLVSRYAKDKAEESELAKTIAELTEEKDKITEESVNKPDLTDNLLLEIQRKYSSFYNDKSDVYNSLVSVISDIDSLSLNAYTPDGIIYKLPDEMSSFLPESYAENLKNFLLYREICDGDIEEVVKDFVDIVMSCTDTLSPYMTSKNEYIHNMELKSIGYPDIDGIKDTIRDEDFKKCCDDYENGLLYSFTFNDIHNEPLIYMEVLYRDDPTKCDIGYVEAKDHFKEKYPDLTTEQLNTIVDEIGKAIQGYENKFNGYFLTAIENISEKQHRITAELNEKNSNLNNGINNIAFTGKVSFSDKEIEAFGLNAFESELKEGHTITLNKDQIYNSVDILYYPTFHKYSIADMLAKRLDELKDDFLYNREKDLLNIFSIKNCDCLKDYSDDVKIHFLEDILIYGNLITNDNIIKNLDNLKLTRIDENTFEFDVDITIDIEPMFNKHIKENYMEEPER